MTAVIEVPLESFLAERCVFDPDAVSRAGKLYQAYTDYSKDAGKRPVNQARFKETLLARPEQVDHDHDKHGSHWIGIRVGNTPARDAK